MIEFSIGKTNLFVMFHNEYYITDERSRKSIVCMIHTVHPNRVAAGMATINPDDDVVTDKIGKACAFKRAVSSLLLQDKDNWLKVDDGWWLSQRLMRAIVHQYYSAYRAALWLDNHEPDECTCKDDLPDGRGSKVCKYCCVQARLQALKDGTV